MPSGQLAGGIRETGRIHAAGGGELVVGSDCDGVFIRTSGSRRSNAAAVILDHDGREAFSRAYFQACADADDWTAAQEAPVPP